MQTAIEVSGDLQTGWKLSSKDGSYVTIGYDGIHQEVFVDRTHAGTVTFSANFPARTAAPLRAANNDLASHIPVDRNSIEVLAGNGRVAITNLVFPEHSLKCTFLPVEKLAKRRRRSGR